MEFSFERIAIVNRGEPARRLITAVRELNAEYARALKTIALYTDPDRRAMFVRDADESYSLGPATYVDPRDGKRKSSYLDYQRLETALRAIRAEAVWVGWGFVAEHAEFADLCARMGVVFIGPSGDVMRALGDKIRSKQAAEAAEVPVAPWSGGPVESLEDAHAQAERLGFPLMVKATAGGGGRGIRKVLAADGVKEAFESARSEALSGFGDDTVFMERMVTGARHVEVQIIADHTGRTWALGVRDCSVQRRNQKVIEESPSPVMTREQEASLCAAAARLGQTVGYVNAGTVEFLYAPESGVFSFMEVNARLQVEHPVTEMITGLDIVKLQLHVAAGGTLDGDPPEAAGHAIEVRLNAEDPGNNFAPAPGAIELFRLPIGSGLRIDTGVEVGDVVPADFDSMIAKFIAHGRTRAEAMARLRRALAESAVVIRGGMSNKGFLLELLGKPEIESSDYDVGWLDRLVAAGEHVSHRHVDVALSYAAIAAYESEAALERLRFFRSAARGRPEVGSEHARTVEVGHLAAHYEFEVRRLSPDRYQVKIDDCAIEIAVEQRGDLERRLTIGDRTHRVLAVTEGATSLIEVDGVPHRISHDSAGVVRATAPAVVVSVAVAPGDEVAIGDRLAVLEAMKTEMPIVAKVAGRVREVLVQNNVQVAPGARLLVIEPPEGEGNAVASARISFAELAAYAARCAAPDDPILDLRRLMLGFDTDADKLRRYVAERGVLSGQDDPADADLWQRESELLAIFTDLLALFRRQPARSDEYDDTRLSSSEYLLTYLRDIGGRGEGLPPAFLDKLRQALGHYGVRELDPTPELEEALFRIYKAHYQVEDQRTPMLSVLQRKIDHLSEVRDLADETFRSQLGRLVGVTQSRLPAINDLARETRYHFFEQPVLEAVRERVYGEMSAHLDHLSENPEADDRDQVMQALIDCPQPVRALLARRLSSADAELKGLMLEILVRRYYHDRELENLRCQNHEGEHFFLADYTYGGIDLSVAAMYVAEETLADTIPKAASLAAQLPPTRDVALELYVVRQGALGSPNEAADRVHGLLQAAAFPPHIRRIAVALSPRQGKIGLGGVQHFTYRPDDSGGQALIEEKRFRGLHPMMTKRLRLWRFDAFEIERLPSVDDMYLYRAVGRDNPSDERLVALAEVRDLTAVRDQRGRRVGLPYLERQFMEALNAIRRVQAQRPAHKRLQWNRVQLFVWPVLEFEPVELNQLARRLAPGTEGLGIERVLIEARTPDPDTGVVENRIIDLSNPGGGGLAIEYREPPTEPMKPLDPYTQRVVRLRQRGLVYPYELLRMLAPPRDGVQSLFPPGEFTEYDLDDSGERLVPIERAPGQNRANIVAGVIRSFTDKYPEGIARVVLASDPSRGMGALAEPECRTINAAIELARAERLPIEWYALSAGAKIAMDSGTENMDWIALVLRRVVEFTQDGGEMNIVVTGINVGAQPYWNAEATMMMHTRGVLIMVEGSAMVLTGKRALDYSGGVSAEDNAGIGGYERVMGPNGQAQYYAADVSEACQLLLRYYEHTYVVAGERFPRRAETADSATRDVCEAPHLRGTGFERVGEVFSDATNPGRKKTFDIRSVLKACSDHDHEPLERWFAMRDAEVAVVWDAHVGGYPVCMLGIESRPLSRLGYVPADGPETWTAGTLFPFASKKVARAINAASNNRPVVVLANLSGFDGSPESMRNFQLEYGAEIGRAVVNFRGPIVFCVISRYHGGAFVVFSNKLNEHLEVAALEGTQASVIGGAPAAAVVFAREVDKRALADERVRTLEREMNQAQGAERVRLRVRYGELVKEVHAEKLGQVATEFDRIHSVHRAQEVGSVHHIVPPAELRPYLIAAIERGMKRVLAGADA